MIPDKVMKKVVNQIKVDQLTKEE